MIRFNESAWVTLETQIDYKTSGRDQRNQDKRPCGSLLVTGRAAKLSGGNGAGAGAGAGWISLS